MSEEEEEEEDVLIARLARSEGLDASNFDSSTAVVCWDYFARDDSTERNKQFPTCVSARDEEEVKRNSLFVHTHKGCANSIGGGCSTFSPVSRRRREKSWKVGLTHKKFCRFDDSN